MRNGTRWPVCIVVALTAALLLCSVTTSGAGLRLEIESGYVGSGYNDVRIPGDTGTDISLNDDLSTDAAPYFRARVEYDLGERHTVSALYAPLTLSADGTLAGPVDFAGVTYPGGTDVDGTYTFNSYRLTYRYALVRGDRFSAGIGFTGKIRDAVIRLEGGGLSSEKTDVGFVPLLNFKLVWTASDRVDLLLEGDALAAPQGRAEDVIAGAVFHATDNLDVRVGYRIVEGGADNDEVYTFALLNYASVGLVATF